MAGKGIEINIQRLDICRAMHRALRTIHHGDRACGVSEGDSPFKIRAAAGDVGHLPQRQNPGTRRYQFGKAVDIR